MLHGKNQQSLFAMILSQTGAFSETEYNLVPNPVTGEVGCPRDVVRQP